MVAAELIYFRSGIFGTAQYWWSMVIIFAFQIPVDGWLTKLSDPIVIYNPERCSDCGRRGTFRSKTSDSDSPWSRSLSCCGGAGWIAAGTPGGIDK